VPELPEVEVARRNLERWLGGRKIVRAELSPRVFVGRARAVGEKLCGRTLKAVERRGKWLHLLFDGGQSLYSHLGMTGKWVLRDRDAPPQRFERGRLDSARRSVRYFDPRLLGRVQLLAGDAAPATFRALGPDPLVDGIDVVQLHNKLSRRRKSIKETLLDQTLLAGVGNIQAAEALWRARIHPARASSSLTAAEARALAGAIAGSIADTLARQDSPEITYVEEAGADNPFSVYGKQGEPCPRCRTTLVRILQGGRSTVFCPRCQSRRARRARAT
jgi:formamidopyrimidine-DNA glycosylase